jgi:SAM-dependent methyltransferase
VTVLDRPRVDQTQHELHLGVTDDELAHLRSRRSNIREVVLGDFLTAPLEEQSFDVVVAVEVIEHVVEDSAFVERLAAVLRPGGIAYLTTPNGDYVRNEGPHFNPDHLRHYRLDQLQGLLERSFHRVIVTYGVKTGRFRYHGLFGDLSPRRPLASLVTASNNVVSRLESRDLQFQPSRTAHLFAVAWREDGR